MKGSLQSQLRAGPACLHFQVKRAVAFEKRQERGADTVESNSEVGVGNEVENKTEDLSH